MLGHVWSCACVGPQSQQTGATALFEDQKPGLMFDTGFIILNSSQSHIWVSRLAAMKTFE